nr:NmrA family NAD(P)-binding protein [Streptomyces cupreus]
MTALVTGATGNVGSRAVTELRALGVRVGAFVRDPGRAAALIGGETELAVGDFGEPSTIRRALEGVDRVVLICPNDLRQAEYGTRAIDASVAAGVAQVVFLSTVGAQIGSPLVFFDQHGRIEEHLHDSGIPGVVLRAGHLMSNVIGSAATIAQTGRFFLPARDAPIAMVDPSDVASTSAVVLTTAGHTGRTYELTGPEAISYADVARRLSSVLGRSVEYVDVPDVAAVFGALRAGVNASTTGTVGELTGREPRRFEEFARSVAPLLLGGQRD